MMFLLIHVQQICFSHIHQQLQSNKRTISLLNLFVLYSSSKDNSEVDSLIFAKFLSKLYDNGEILFSLHQIKILLQSEEYQFLNKKLENKKVDFINFFQTIIRYQHENSCRSLKSICRLSIKTNIKQFPDGIKQLSTYPSMNDRFLTYLTYENKYALDSYA